MKLGDHLYKKIVAVGEGKEIDLDQAEVFYDYAMFLEGSKDPFVSSILAKEHTKINVKAGVEPSIPGVYLALSSMVS